MDAAKMMQVWQRILREDALFEAIESPDFEDRVKQLDLTEEEVDVARAYARHGDRIKWPRNYFQYATQQQVLIAISQHAPLTFTWLTGKGCDVSELALDHLRASNWPDRGPNLCRCCAEFLDHLLGREELASIAGVADVIALEKTGISLLQRLRDTPTELWLAPDTPELLDTEVRYQRTPGGAVITVDHIVTPVLTDPDESAGKPLQPGRQHFLLFLTSLDEDVGYAVLQDEAKTIFDALEEPLSLVEAAALLEGDADEARQQAHSALTRFLNLGVIRPVAAMAARPGADGSRAPGTWDDVALARGSDATECFDALVASMIECCGDVRGKRVVDAGMGNGLSTLALARHGANALGVDISERAVEGANALIASVAGDVASRLSFRVMDAARLDLDAGSFDIVTCLKTIWCFPDIARALREFHRVLRPGGLIVIQLWDALERCSLLQAGSVVLDRFNPHRRQPAARAGHHANLDPGELERLLREAGFSAVAQPAHHARTFEITSPAHFWDQFRSVADGGYYYYARLGAAEKAAMDEQWLMETSASRGPSSATLLTLEWTICSARKPAR